MTLDMAYEMAGKNLKAKYRAKPVQSKGRPHERTSRATASDTKYDSATLRVLKVVRQESRDRNARIHVCVALVPNASGRGLRKVKIRKED